MIAFVHLILGTIGGLAAAYFLGRTVNPYSTYRVRYDRNWMLTIVVFLIVMLGILTLFVILMALDELLANQQYMVSQLEELEAKTVTSVNADSGQGGPVVRASNSKADLLGSVSRSGSSAGHTWICPDCGETNSIGSRTCKGCGRDK